MNPALLFFFFFGNLTQPPNPLVIPLLARVDTHVSLLARVDTHLALLAKAS